MDKEIPIMRSMEWYMRERKDWRRRVDNIAVRMVGMKDELARLGLYATMHALDEATRKLGYEIAEVLQKGSDGGHEAKRP